MSIAPGLGEKLKAKVINNTVTISSPNNPKIHLNTIFSFSYYTISLYISNKVIRSINYLVLFEYSSNGFHALNRG